MEYRGIHTLFDSSRITTYPLAKRTNKVTRADLLSPQQALATTYPIGDKLDSLGQLADAIINARRHDRAVICMTGAHLIKNGLGPLLIDLMEKRLVTLVGTNGGAVTHDFELALIGETSEVVPNALPNGTFGMARELSYINAALTEAHACGLGFGEGLGRMICNDEFRTAVVARLGLSQPITFGHPDISVIAAAGRLGLPLTVHVGIGTDVIDQHANFDPLAKGACSGRDFRIFANDVARLGDGGVFLNVGSAVTGPEVLLKAVSMTRNVGHQLDHLITADFDLKDYRPEAMTDDSHAYYYYRHHKSIVSRIPAAFHGKAFTIQGNHRQTVPALYQEIIKRL